MRCVSDILAALCLSEGFSTGFSSLVYLLSIIRSLIFRLILETLITRRAHAIHRESWGIAAAYRDVVGYPPGDHLHPTTRHMDIEEQTRLLAPIPEYLEAVKVFPLIPHIRKDAVVRAVLSSELLGLMLSLSTRSL